MYLADNFSRLTHAAMDPEARAAINLMPNDQALRFYLGLSKATLDEYELFTFERSALIAASDMRVDRQRGLEAVAEILLDKPRKLFMEASYEDRLRAFSEMRAMPPRNDPSIGDPGRVGIAFDIHGGGRATIQVAWTTPRSDARIFSKDLFRQIGIPKSQMKFMQRLCCLNWSAFQIQIDLSKRINIDHAEFARRVEQGDPDCVYFYKAALESGVTDKPANTMRHGWNLMRLNSLAEAKIDRRAFPHLEELLLQSGATNDAERNHLLETLRSDLDGEIVFALAMAAVLEIKDIDLSVRKERPVPPLRKRVISKKKSGGEVEETGPQPRLGVVSLNLTRDIVQEIYANSASSSAPKKSGGPGTPKTRHPVRGHLFLARNRKIVYRRPHFRGTVKGQFITRVL
jgi:hypothetical protein